MKRSIIAITTIVATITASLIINSCTEDLPLAPQGNNLITLNVSSTSVAGGTAQMSGSIVNYNAKLIKEAGFCWSTNENPTINDTKTTATVSKDSIQATIISGLEPSTKYFIRGYAMYGTTPIYSNQFEFTTTQGLPQVSTSDITNITATTATSGGTIIDDGGFEITACGVCWSTKQNPTVNDNVTIDEINANAFVSELSNLQTDTTYYVRAYATNKGGTVYGDQKLCLPTALKADFLISDSTIVPMGSVEFVDKSTNNPTAWTWYFGDGNTSTEKNPKHQYVSVGNYTVSLVAASKTERDSISKVNCISVFETIAPVSDFISDTTNVVEGGTVNFIDKSKNIPTKWEWDFGDGNSSTEQNPEHVYTTKGVYTVSLLASNDYGENTETKANYITVIEAIVPTAAFDVDKTTVEINEQISFSDQSTNNPTQWEWDFGDGAKSNEQNPNHSYSSAGLFTVKLTATNQFGSNVNEKTDFIKVIEYGSVSDYDGNNYKTIVIGEQTWMAENLKVTKYPDGTEIPLVSSNTDWGSLGDYDNHDGYCNSTYGALYTYAAAKDACMTGWHLPNIEEWLDLNNFLTSEGFDGNEGKALKADYNWGVGKLGTDDFGFTGLPNGSRDASDGAMELAGRVAVFWTSTALTNYSSVKSVSLTDIYSYITLNYTKRMSEGVSVRCLKNNESAPRAFFYSSDEEIYMGEYINFNDGSTNLPTSWLWDFGDGTTSSEQHPTHTYLVPGIYSVSLTVSNNFGSDYITKNNYVTVNANTPIAEFVSDKTEISEGDSISFTDQSTNVNSWAWDFGDGGTSTDQNPTYTYTSAGIYTVSLTSTNSYGNSTETKTDYITVTAGISNVTNPTTGKTWIDRNLGATQVATSSIDAAAYGDLYQWGRTADGHHKRTSSITSTLSTSNTPGHGDFITNSSHPFDWRSPQNDNLWQGVNGTNNPCPSGYRLPTEAEWHSERQSWSTDDGAGAFASPLKLPPTGYRNYVNGSLQRVGSDGYYWSSTVNGTNSQYLLFHISGSLMNSAVRTCGCSIRCVMD